VGEAAQHQLARQLVPDLLGGTARRSQSAAVEGLYSWPHKTSIIPSWVLPAYTSMLV
jgi:hypothetical protein